MKKVFDAHIHHKFEMPIEEAIRILSLEFAETETDKYTFLALPTEIEEGKVVIRHMQNLRMLFLKHIFSPSAYAYAGLVVPKDVKEWRDEELSSLYLSEAKEYYAAGFDGIKMLEGYPSLRREMERPLCHAVYDPFYSYLEDMGIPVTMHVANPKENWDPERCDEYAKRVGRFCDESYPSFDTLISEVFGIMEKHPRLKLTLAHFGFLGEDIDLARKFLDNYANTCFDVTPGGEQLVYMQDKWGAWHEFFREYRERIIYGSDYYAFPMGEKWKENFTRRPTFLRRFFEGDGNYSYGKYSFFGVKMEEEIIDLIYRKNSERLLGAPRKIDYSYMRREIERLSLIDDLFETYAREDLKFISEAIEGK